MNSIPLGSDKDFNVLFKDTLLPRVKKSTIMMKQLFIIILSSLWKGYFV